MEFNIQKFLSENKLTGQSQMREEDNTELTMHVGDDYEEMQDADRFDDNGDERDDWNKQDFDDTDEYEKEPTAKDVKQDDPALKGIHKKQAQLQGLEAEKDRLLMQLKGNVISLDQYKQSIGNIPNQIKKLRADIDKAMTVTADDGSEEDMV
jgi:hypothetical protein